MIKTLEQQLKELPPELLKQVADFVQFLIAKQLDRKYGKPTFRWAGALKDLRGRYTSVQLQHQISEWRA